MIRHASQTIDFTTAPVSEAEAIDWSYENPAADFATEEQQVVRHSPMSRSLRIVGILAFGQSVAFLVIWLLICASAGAASAPAKAPEFKPDMQVSTYKPTKARDPFAAGPVAPSAASSGGTTAVTSLQLDGILYSATDPSAIVNGQLVSLNKSVTMDLGGGDVKVRAIKILRDRATIQVGTQMFELFLNQQPTDTAEK